MAIRAGLFSVLIGLTGGAVSAEAPPLSAIDWLSDSVSDAGDPPASEGSDEGAAHTATLPDAVTVMPLDAPVMDGAGVIAAEALDLPADLWGRSSAKDLATELGRVRLSSDAPPAIRRFLTALLQARLDPPIDAAVDERFFFARVDRLLEQGHLDAAAALIAGASARNAQTFRRKFDIALLLGRETEACREIESTPELSPTYPARIFCLARLGQFDVAALTLGNAETLGILSEREDALLLHFLDPELFEGEPIPPAPAVPTPLQFRLYEAVGERIATDNLPVAFAHADLSSTVGWKARLAAAERLAAIGAIPFEHLLKVFEERTASASGGVWERVQAAQTLAEALRDGDDTALAASLPAAWAAAGQAGYAAGLAEFLLPHLQGLDDLGRASHLVFEIALAAEDAETAKRFSNQSNEDRFLLSIAGNGIGSVPAGDALGRAVLRGLSSVKSGPAYETLIEDDRRGEALLRALDQLAEGATGNPEVTAQSLIALRRIGLTKLARQIAIELILSEGAA